MDDSTPSSAKRLLHFALAGLCFVLVIVAILLPVVPLTPFAILTSYFLVRASPRLDARLHRSRLFGPTLRDWELHRGVRLPVKVAMLSMLAIGTAASLWFYEFPTGVRIALVSLAIGLAIVVLRVNTVRGP